jgi:hypothetical protein
LRPSGAGAAAVRVRVAQVAEVTCARGTGAHAGRLAVFGLQVLVVDAVNAERTLFHHAIVGVVFARAVRARPRAQLAADADVRVDQHDAVFGALVAGAGRAHGHAGRRFAVQARAREMQCAAVLALAGFVAVDAVEPRPHRIRAVGVDVRQRRRITLRVPLLARGGARLAANAGVEVDDQAQLLLTGLRSVGKRCHQPLPFIMRSPIFMAARSRPGGRFVASNCGSVTAAPSAFSTRTRRSYQAACPVTGSELD